MFNLIRPVIGLTRRTAITPVAGFATNSRLFAQSATNTGKELHKESKKSNMYMIGAIGLAAGLAFAYYEYRQSDSPVTEDKRDKK